MSFFVSDTTAISLYGYDSEECATLAEAFEYIARELKDDPADGREFEIHLGSQDGEQWIHIDARQFCPEVFE